MKFPAADGSIITVKADTKEARQCYMQSLKIHPYSVKTIEEHETQSEQIQTPLVECNSVDQEVRGLRGVDLDPRAEFEENRLVFNEPMVTVQLGADCQKVTQMGHNSHQLVRDSIEAVLKANSDLFAWSPANMPGIDPDFMCHKLSLLSQARPVAQRKRKLGEERRVAVEAEVKQLAQTHFIREVMHTTWLANAVMVRKASGKWRMCVDYTDLNKACPKDTYPLPSIDRLVDSTSGFEMLSFLDAYSGYNQI